MNNELRMTLKKELSELEDLEKKWTIEAHEIINRNPDWYDSYSFVEAYIAACKKRDEETRFASSEYIKLEGEIYYLKQDVATLRAENERLINANKFWDEMRLKDISGKSDMIYSQYKQIEALKKENERLKYFEVFHATLTDTVKNKNAEQLIALLTEYKSALREAYPWVEDYNVNHPEWCNCNSIEPRCTCGEEALLQRKIAWLEKHKALMGEV